MGEGRKHARDEQRRIARAQGGHAVADDEQRHQAEQQRFALDAAGKRRQDRRTEGDAECVDTDNETGERQVDVKVACDGGQETDDDEFGCADRIGSDRQGKESQRHEITRSNGTRQLRMREFLFGKNMA